MGPQNENISRRERVAITLVVLGIYALYYPVSIFTDTLPYHSPISVVDTALPLIPEWIIIYAFIYLLGCIPAALIQNRTLFHRMAFAYVAVQLFSFAVFIVAPVRMLLRPDTVVVDSFITWALQLCYFVDKPVNCCPSLHVAVAVLGALCTHRVDHALGKVALVVGFLISLSTLLVKQHLLVDVALGFTIAAVAYRLLVTPCEVPPLTDADRRDGRRWVVVLTCLYTSVFAAFYGAYSSGWNPWETP
jgi:membrane-associated phospholipid phosphatase